jgi:hypothetical protein
MATSNNASVTKNLLTTTVFTLRQNETSVDMVIPSTCILSVSQQPAKKKKKKIG